MNVVANCRFDRFVVEPARRRLLIGGEPVKIGGRAFDVLMALIERRNRAVSKRELLDLAWPGLAVEEGNLQVQIFALRKILGAAAIATIPGRGYQFAAAIEGQEPPIPAIPADWNAAAVVADVEGADRPHANGRDNEAELDVAKGTVAANQAQHETRSKLDQGQCRQLTIMASELIGLESLAARLDAEDLSQATAACYRRCAEIIEQRHGYVAHAAGDGLLAYFGFPQAREQDAENCTRAALALQDLARRLSAEFGTALQPCIGIATGIMVIGDDPAAKEPIALGEALNLSGRLRALAKPGQIIIANSTRRLLGGLFEYHDLGRVALKGSAAPAEIAQVLGESGIESRFEAHHPANLTPLVGRDEEIELLLRRWRRARDGEGSVVALVGEPGIGKSRVAQTVLDLLSGETHAPLRLFCSPHHQDSPLYPFISQLERAAGFCRGDTDEQRLVKLETALGYAASDVADGSLLLAQLLHVSTGDRHPSRTLTPERRREKTLEALAAHVERLAASQPVLLVIEDLHWADPTSLELIDLMVERAPQHRLLVILTSRPEFVSPWAGRTQTTAMTLGRLPPRQSVAIIASVAQGKPLPEAVTEQILDRADGIPLFVEELTKAVVESAAPVDGGDRGASTGSLATVGIPTTLHASLLARLDRLASAREVVQIGAALGRRFSHQLISAVAAMPQQRLDEALAGLVNAQLIWRRGSAPHAEYTFKHALLQDAAYGTLRRAPRRALHARIADAIASQFVDIAGAQPELLAHHCAEAGLIEKAAALWGMAGQLSLTRSALKEATAHFTRALGLIEILPGTPDLRREQIKLQIALANALMHTKGYAAPETKSALAQARLLVARAEALGEPPEDPLPLLSVLHGFWVASHVAFEGDAVRDLAVEFMTLAQKQQTIFPLVLGHRLMGTSLLYLGDIAGGRAHLDRAIALYDPVEHRPLATRFGHDVGAAVLSNRPLALWLLGYPEAALKDADDAISHAREIGQTGTFLYALTRIAWLHLIIGDYGVAAAQIRELMAIASDVEGSYWTAAGIMLQGCLFALTGDGASAIEMITSGIAASRLKGSNLLRMPWYLSCLTTAHVTLGQYNEAERCIGEAMTAMAKTKEAWQESDLHRMAGDLALTSPTPNAMKAEAHYRRALAVARRQKAKSWELRAATSLARLWRDRGKRRQALDLLAPIHGWFAEGFKMSDFKQADALLAELSSADRSRRAHEDHRRHADAFRVE
jgi:class 3 adenylate cyclase/predicted ATPase